MRGEFFEAAPKLNVACGVMVWVYVCPISARSVRVNQSRAAPMHIISHLLRRPARSVCRWLILLGLWGGGLVDAASQIRFEVSLGYDGTVREANWFPVNCEAINSGPNFNGFIEVAPGPGAKGQVQRWPIELPTGTLKRVTIPVFATTRYAANWEVRLVDDRGKVREEVAARAQRQIGQETKLVGALPRTAAGTVSLRTIKRTQQPDLQPASARFSRDLFPDNPLLLEGLDAIYLHSETAINLRAAQANALQAWLKAGGHLIVAIEQAAEVTAVPWLHELLPFEPVEVGTGPKAAAVADWVYAGTLAPSRPAPRGGQRPAVVESGASPSVFGEWQDDPVFREAELRVVRGKLREGQVVLAAGGTPLIVAANRGLGRVTVLLFSPEREPVRSWKELPTFWTQLAEVPLSLYASTDYHRGYGVAIDSLFGAMIDSRQVSKLPVGWLLLLLVVYLLVIGPFDRIWLKKINRPMLTWITFPGYVVLFSGLIYFIGYKLRAGDSEYNELHLVTVLPAGDRAEWRGRTYASIYSPGNARYPLQSELKFALLRGEYLASRGGDTFDKGELTHTGDNFKAEAFVPVWTSQLYLSDWWQSGSLPVVARLTATPTGWQVELRNQSGQPIDAAWLAVENLIFELEALAPGQAKTLALNRSAGRSRQDFIQSRLGAYENAARERQFAFGRSGSGRIDDLSTASVIASLLDEFGPSGSGQNFVAPSGFGVSAVMQRGDAMLFAWSGQVAPVPGLNRFKSNRSASHTLWRQPLVVGGKTP